MKNYHWVIIVIAVIVLVVAYFAFKKYDIKPRQFQSPGVVTPRGLIGSGSVRDAAGTDAQNNNSMA